MAFSERCPAGRTPRLLSTFSLPSGGRQRLLYKSLYMEFAEGSGAVSGCRSLPVVRVSYWIQLARCNPDQARRLRAPCCSVWIRYGSRNFSSQDGGSRILRAQLNRQYFFLHIATVNDDQRTTLFNFELYFKESYCWLFYPAPKSNTNDVSDGRMSL